MFLAKPNEPTKGGGNEGEEGRQAGRTDRDRAHCARAAQLCCMRETDERTDTTSEFALRIGQYLNKSAMAFLQDHRSNESHSISDN